MLLTAQVANRDFPEKSETIMERRRLWNDIRPESSGNPGSFCQVAQAFWESQTGWWSGQNTNLRQQSLLSPV